MAEEKIYKYRGLKLEELQKLSIEELAALFPSDSRRKLKRGFTEEEKTFMENLRDKNAKKLKTHSRDLIVLPEMVGKKISIHSGKEFTDVLIVEEMIGHRFGELVPTRKIGVTHSAVVKEKDDKKNKED